MAKNTESYEFYASTVGGLTETELAALEAAPVEATLTVWELEAMERDHLAYLAHAEVAGV